MTEGIQETFEDVKGALEDVNKGLKSLGSQAPTTQIPQPPALPQEHELDNFESLLVDAILWKEDAAKTRIKLAKEEMDSCKVLRQNLMAKLVARLGVSPSEYMVSINQDTRKATTVKRP